MRPIDRSLSMIAGPFTAFMAIAGLLAPPGCGTREKETVPNPHAVELMIQKKMEEKLPGRCP